MIKLLEQITNKYLGKKSNLKLGIKLGLARNINNQVIITMLAYFYCAAYTSIIMYESSPPCEQRRITFTDDGQRVQLARPELPAPHYFCMFRLLPTTSPSPSRHYYPRLIAGTNLPTPKGWIAWLAKADCTHISIAQGYYTIESEGTRRK